MKNQCDGCKLGLPLDEHGVHYHPNRTGYERLHMACTQERYSGDLREYCAICGKYLGPLPKRTGKDTPAKQYCMICLEIEHGLRGAN